MLFELAAHLCVDILTLAIGGYVFAKNPRGIIHRAFFLFVLGIVGWSASMVFLSLTMQQWLITLPFFGAELMVLGFFLLAEVFPSGALTRKCLLCLLAPWLIVVLLTPSELIVRTAVLNAAGYLTPEHGPLFPLFGIVMGAYIMWGITRLALKYRRLRGIRRVQMRYFAAGAAIFLSLAFLTNVFLPLFHVFRFNLFGPLFSVIFIGTAAYAIVRHQFMDIRVVIQRGLLYAASIGLIACVFFGVDFVVRRFTDLEGWTDDVLAAIVGAFGFVWFRRFFERVTDPVFFRGDYHYMTAVHELGPLLHATIDLESLLRGIDGFLARTIKPECVAFVVAARGVPLVRIFPHRAAHAAVPTSEAALLQASVNANRPVFFQEEKWGAGLARPEGIVAVIPLLAHEGRIATLFLGKKLSDDIMRTKDIELLLVLAHHAGLAIENARLYEAERRHGEELERRVAERTEEVRHMQETQARFVTDISHELQTPVAVLAANMEVLEGKRKGSRAMALAAASSALDRMAQMVDHVLAIARLNFSKEELHKTEIAVENLVEDIYHDCAILAEEKGITLSYMSDAIRVIGDRDKLKAVILNLISNALKHTPRGGKIALTAKVREGRAEICVRDTGTGIPPDKLPHIFERFYRINAGDGRGSGLGLDICKQIVEMHGGAIHAGSVLGEGSAFTFSLPLAAVVTPSPREIDAASRV